MKKIGKIFLDCLTQLRGNIVAIVIIFGLVLLPSLYAWFSLLAFWNPEGSTGNVSIAVANCDEGYQSDLLPSRIDAGAEVTNDLRANDKFHWVFVKEDEAIDGVKAGRYYAAIIIPPEFSKDIVSVFSSQMENPSIQYYVNEKINPVAPHLTSIGASTIQADIDSAFSETVANTALGVNSNLAQFMNGEGVASYASTLMGRLGSASGEMKMDASQVRAFSALLGQSQTLIETSSNALERTSAIVGDLDPLIDQTKQGFTDALQGTDGFATLASQALSNARSAFSKIETASNSAFDAMSNDPQVIKDQIVSLVSDLNGVEQAYGQARSAIVQTDPKSPLLNTIDTVLKQTKKLKRTLGEVSEDIDTDAAALGSARAKIAKTVSESTAALDQVQSTYETTLKQQADSLKATLDKLGSDTKDVARDLDETAGSLATASEPLVKSISHVRDSLDSTALLLESSSLELAHSHDELKAALDSKDLAQVRRIIGSDPTTLAKILTTPTQIDKHAVYGVANYGSAMSPFYTSLAIFIGSIFLVIILNVRLTPERRARLGDPKPYQEYFGNLSFFLVLSIAQALLICTGNLFFLGVQCQSLPLYYLTGISCAVVFTNLIYAFVFAFGDIGKALAVILLVAQVAGSGGELPIQLSAPIFQDIYPWLPFTHSMNLFQGAIAGIYGNQYVVSLACLLAFIVFALLIGLVLRRPIAQLNDFIDAELKKTGVM